MFALISPINLLMSALISCIDLLMFVWIWFAGLDVYIDERAHKTGLRGTHRDGLWR